jgi:hypothetical protein
VLRRRDEGPGGQTTEREVCVRYWR